MRRREHRTNIVCVPVGVLLIDSREQRRLSSTLPAESNRLPDSERVSRSLFEQFNFRVKEGRDRQIQQELRHLRITTEQLNVSVKNFSGIINYSSEANIVLHPSIVTQLCHAKPSDHFGTSCATADNSFSSISPNKYFVPNQVTIVTSRINGNNNTSHHVVFRGYPLSLLILHKLHSERRVGEFTFFVLEIDCRHLFLGLYLLDDNQPFVLVIPVIHPLFLFILFSLSVVSCGCV